MKGSAAPENTSIRLLRLPEVRSQTGLSRSTLYLLMHKGKFPNPVNLVPGGRSVAWRQDQINCWIQERILASEKAEALRSPAATKFQTIKKRGGRHGTSL